MSLDMSKYTTQQLEEELDRRELVARDIFELEQQVLKDMLRTSKDEVIERILKNNLGSDYNLWVSDPHKFVVSVTVSYDCREDRYKDY